MFSHTDILTALASRPCAVSGTPSGAYPRAVVDSRLVQPGDLFVALRGERVDGNDYVGRALAAGAAGALVERLPADPPAGVVLYQVDDCLKALQAVAAHFWAQRPLPALEITGTVGKTSTKEVAGRLFGQRYDVLMTEGGLNGDTGMPLVLLRREPHHTFAVIELGMHYRGEITLQCGWAPPRYGIVTNIGYTHMERVGSREGIVLAKRELVECLPASGTVALNADDPLVLGMRDVARCRVLTYGLSDGVDVRATAIETRGRAGLRFMLHQGGCSVAVTTPLVGEHNVYTCLSVAAIALADGFALAEIAAGLATAENPLRLRFTTGPHGATVIDDTYNASPASMAAALRVLAGQPGRRIAVLGDMLELGEVERDLHHELGERAAVVADVLYTVGPRARWIAEAARAAGLADVREHADKEPLAEALRAEARPGDVILLKGSRGLALETVVAGLC